MNQTLQFQIKPEQANTYLFLPFTMPPDVEVFSLAYRYERYTDSLSDDGFTSRQKINAIDLGLLAPDGTQVGYSGTAYAEITVSETSASPCYKPHPLTPGEWKILVGVHMVAPEGVTVTYELAFTFKHLRLLKGDLHTHTLQSDGVQTAEELAWRARRNGLDFLAVTDHNNQLHPEALPQVPGLTLIPGIEWTHYRGHANFLGVHQPYDGTHAVTATEDVQALFEQGKQRGALITINHPFEPGCEFLFDMSQVPFDCLEIWNGPMREPNLKSLALWQSLLAAGKRVPICGGSDYHREYLFLFLGDPTTCVYALSASPSDILAALRQGHAFLTFAPDGPTLEMTCGDAMLGDEVRWEAGSAVDIRVEWVAAGDVIRVVDAKGSRDLITAPAAGKFHTRYAVESPGFVRVEVWRKFLPQLPALPALVGNPIYFCGQGDGF